MSSLNFGILTVSDSCFAQKQNDESGPLLCKLVQNENFEFGDYFQGSVVLKYLVPDEEDLIQKTLIEWSDHHKINVILTTGGTGFSHRDVTPEATKKVVDKETPGLSGAMLSESLKITPYAMLSRSFSGIRKQTLIINFPGSAKAVRECFVTVARVIPHAVALITDKREEIKITHDNLQKNGDVPVNICKHKMSKRLTLGLDNVAGRSRESPYPMISVESALKMLKSSVQVNAWKEQVNLWDSHGRILADSITSQCDLPPFRASIKDGYAVLAEDGKGVREVLRSVEAGQAPENIKIQRGQCVRINTGAPVPDVCTAIVQVEDTKLLETDENGKEEKKIEILCQPKAGQDIRLVGSDIKKGQPILAANTILGAVECGILAACGFAKVPVKAVPLVGVLSTGNELQNPGLPLKPGYIYDSNKITLMMLLRENGFQTLDLGIAQDQEDAMIQALTKGLSQVDVLVTTGSVSMGDRDMLKPILEKVFHSTIHFGRVNMKPGKPTTFMTCVFEGKKKYILCLPGNPASATVTAHLFAFPLLNTLMGNDLKPVLIKTRVTQRYLLDSRPEYARVFLNWLVEDGYPEATSTGNQISSNLMSCGKADAILTLPMKTADRGEIKKGDLVDAILLGVNPKM